MISDRAVLAGRLLRAEGARSLFERWRERRVEAARRASFRPATLDRARRELDSVPILNVLPFPLRANLGGVAIALAARLEAERPFRSLALLQHDEGGWRLELSASARRASVRLGGTAWRGLGHETEDPEARRTPPRVVQEVADALGCRLIHFESVTGLPLAELSEWSSGRGFLLSAHDFALFCRRPNLIEQPAARFCGFCRDLARCARCLATDERGASAGAQGARRGAAARLATNAAAIVHASEFARRSHLDLFPDLLIERQRVIAPAAPLAEATRRFTPASPPRHVAFVGQAAAHKGLPDFAAAVSQLRSRLPRIRWSVLGGGAPEDLDSARAAQIETLGYYRAGTLARRLVEHRIDLAVLPSRFPETHCLVLDECLGAGVPVLAADLGALGERTRATGAGWCFDPAHAEAAIAEALFAILGGAARPEARAPAPVSTPTASAAAHLELYREILARAGTELS